MKRGEAVLCVIDYDLFGTNIEGKEGCFVKTDKSSGKHLIWFPCNGEWAELEDSDFKRVNKPGYIPSKYKNFIKNIKTLEYSYGITN